MRRLPIVVTDATAESPQVEREAERAAHYKKRIIPVLVGQSEPGHASSSTSQAGSGSPAVPSRTSAS